MQLKYYVQLNDWDYKQLETYGIVEHGYVVVLTKEKYQEILDKLKDKKE